MRTWGVILFFIAATSEGACPDWVDREDLVPRCPHQGMLGPEFPAIAHVLGQHGTEESEIERLIEVVRKILVHSKRLTPLLYLSMPESTVDRIREAVNAMDVSPETKARYLGSLRPLKAQGTWLQDQFQDFIDPATGRPQLRPVEAYFSRGPASAIANEIHADCPRIEVGELLHSYFPNADDAECEYGGNLECLCRTGLCLRGDNQKPVYARQFCGPKEEVAIPAHWLRVGHVDEYVATFPIPNTKCDVALTIASYRKALEVLEAHPKERLFSVTEDFAPLHKMFNSFCDSLKAPTPGAADAPPTAAAVHEGPEETAGRSPGTAAAAPNCLNATVEQFLAYLKTGDGAHNEKLQREVYDPVAARVVNEMKARLGPGCQVKVVELPQIMRQSPTGAIAYFPNLTNSVPVGDHALVPDPFNSLFRSAAEAAFKEVGIGTSFIPSADLHANDGNLHCATNSIRTCRGNGVPRSHPPLAADNPEHVPAQLGLTDPMAARFFDEGTSEVKRRTLEALLARLKGSLPPKDPALRKAWFERVARLQRQDPSTTDIVSSFLLAMEGDALGQWRDLFKRADADSQGKMLLQVSREVLFDKGSGIPAIALQALDTATDPTLLRGALHTLGLGMISRDEFTAREDRIRTLVAHPDSEVQRAAISLLLNMDALHGAELKTALSSPFLETQKLGVYALSRAQNPAQAEPFLKGLLTSGDGEIRTQVYQLAAESPKALEHFRSALERRPQDRSDLARAFLRNGSPEVATQAIALALQGVGGNDRQQTLLQVQQSIRFQTAEHFFTNAPVNLQQELLAVGAPESTVIEAALSSPHRQIVRLAVERAKGLEDYHYRNLRAPLLAAIQTLGLDDTTRRGLEAHFAKKPSN